MRRGVATGMVALALMVPSACGGSALSPQEARAANDGVAGGSAAAGSATDTTTTGDAGTSTDTSSGDAGTGSTSGSGTSGGAAGSNGPSGGGAGTPAAAGIKAASCAGFKNQKGITDKTITIGNASDISGPVPGLFTSTQQATKAYVEYFNTTTKGICGRKLELLTYDTRTDAGADQQAYQKLCDNTFAAVGSMSGFDAGGASTAQGCGLPDIRTAAVQSERNACSTCFGAQATGAGEFSNAVPDYFLKNYREASQKAAFVYLNAGAGAENAKVQQKVEQKRGMNFVYTGPIDVAEFNYGPYVQAMKSKGVRWVQWLGPYQNGVRLAQAMQQAGFKPDVFLFDPVASDPNFLKTGGSAVEGAKMYINFTPLDQSQTELNLYKQWLQQVAPGAQPTFFGLFAWSAAKLFVEKSIALGGKLDRASLVASMRGVHAWTGGGVSGPMDVGGKHAPSCIRFMQVKDGKWVPLGSTRYMCNGYTKAG